MHSPLLRIGEHAPDFELLDHAGKRVRLSEQLIHSAVLLYFYPADFTPVCTREACAFRNWYTPLTQTHAQVLGISPQDSVTHARFREKYLLPFPLLSDPAKQIIRAYGCSGLLGVRRVTYLIDRDGQVADRVRSAFRISRHITLANRTLNGSWKGG